MDAGTSVQASCSMHVGAGTIELLEPM